MESNLERVQALLKERGLAAALLCEPGRGNFDDWIRPAGGLPILPPFHRRGLWIVPTEGEAIRTCAIEAHPTDPEHYPVFAAAQLDGLVRDGRLGVVNGDRMLEAVWSGIADRFGQVELVELTEEVSWLQACKRPEETAAVAAGARLYDRLFSAVPMLLRPGRTERDVVNDLRFRAGQLGAGGEDLGLRTQVWLTSSGTAPEEAPLSWPGRRLQYGDRIHIAAAGAVPGGVHAALGRCYVLGEASAEVRDHWQTVLEVQQAAARGLAPGRCLADAAAEADRLLESLGRPGLKGLWLHGVGSGWQEMPRCLDGSMRRPLAVGMTIVVAPRLSFSDGEYGCMDVYEITEHGAAALGTTSRELREIR